MSERAGAVVLDGVSVAYGRGEPVLRDVSVAATPGRVLAVTGPSGAGKTTLLLTMAGVLRPADGTVRVDGEPLRDRDHAVASGVVLIPQDNGLAAVASEVSHLDSLVAGAGLDAVQATSDDVAWLMHRSCGLGLPAPRTVPGVPGGRATWDTEDVAAFTDGVEVYQEPYAPTVRVVGDQRRIVWTVPWMPKAASAPRDGSASLPRTTGPTCRPFR